MTDTAITQPAALSKKTAVFRLQITDAVAWLSINVPDASMNTLQASFIDEMDRLLDWLAGQDNVQGLVIYSAKSDNFIAGADIGMIDQLGSRQQAEQLVSQGQRVFARLANLPYHVVAAIDGVCLGGGLELALACHSRVASDAPHTKLGLPEVKLGLLPATGGTQRLPRLIGTLAAIDLMLSGRALASRNARKLGLVDAVVPSSILLDAAKQLALQPKPTRQGSLANWLVSYTALGRAIVFHQAKKQALEKTHGNYPAVDSILAVIELGLKKGMQAGLQAEAEQFAELVMTKASKALRHLFFLSTAAKKQPDNKTIPIPITSLGVLGAGLMGSGISYVTAMQAGIQVKLKDLSNQNLIHALRYSYELLLKKVQRRQLSQVELQTKMTAIIAVTDYHKMGACDMVIEAAFEDLVLKQQLLEQVEAHFSPETIFASNTSSIPIAEIASKAQRPEQVIGIHYFSPVEKMPLVEIIAHAGTSDQTIATALKFVKQQGKTAIVVADKAGFYVNRILAAYLNEAARILTEGEPIDGIDSALVNFGFPLGPFALLDEVGVDVCAKVSPVLYQGLGERFSVPALFSSLLANGLYGKKTKQGFYVYKQRTKKVNQRIYALMNRKPKAVLDEQEVALRCFVAMLNECARCIDEQVIASAADGDIGAVFGIGFPPFLGGPFCYMNALGIGKTVKLMKKLQRRYGERFAPCDLLVKMMNENTSF